MLYNNDFKYDLKVGQIGEKALASLFKDKKIEVKTDFMAQKTGNVFVEYSSRGKQSGIATTEADYWCFIVSNDQLAIVSTAKTKELARKHWDKRVKGGDSNTSNGVLVPLTELLAASESK